MSKYDSKFKKFSSPALDEHRSSPQSGPYQKKSLSQVFLTTDEPLNAVTQKLKELGIRRVLEIGPGGGILTQKLIESGLEVTAIEMDDRFADHLATRFAATQGPKGSSLDIIHQDFLKYPLKSWLASKPEKAAIVGNIPYHISSHIVQHILNSGVENLGAVILMTQKEFADRICALPRTKDYGSLSVYVQLRMETSLIREISRSLFKPVPKVDSALFMARPLKTLPYANILDEVERVTRTAFAQRRKKLFNALQSMVKREDILNQNPPVDFNLRADVLTPQDYVLLTQWILSLKTQTSTSHLETP